MKYVFDWWKEIEEQLINNILILLDYDGTITPIVDTPELAFLSDEMRNLIEKISKKYTTAIITGRSLEDIKNLWASMTYTMSETMVLRYLNQESPKR